MLLIGFSIFNVEVLNINITNERKQRKQLPDGIFNQIFLYYNHASLQLRILVVCKPYVCFYLPK